MLRQIVILDPNRPDRPVILLTSILDVPAHLIGQLYRQRWQIELFFRWLKVHAHFEHLISHSQNGVTTGFYIAIIAVLLIYVRTGRAVSKYAYTLLSLVASGQATMQDILPILERRERECELDRQRRARKKAEKTAR
jgi:IS4 transposase